MDSCSRQKLEPIYCNVAFPSFTDKTTLNINLHDGNIRYTNAFSKQIRSYIEVTKVNFNLRRHRCFILCNQIAYNLQCIFKAVAQVKVLGKKTMLNSLNSWFQDYKTKGWGNKTSSFIESKMKILTFFRIIYMILCLHNFTSFSFFQFLLCYPPTTF